MFHSVDGGRSWISGSTSQGSAVDILQLSDSCSETSVNASQGATMSRMFFNKKNFRSLRC
jgi:hypothetical protein